MTHILIIEDDTQLQDIYKRKLTNEGFDATVAASAEDGMDEIIRNMPDLILLDLMLPGGRNGFDFLEELKRNPKYSNIPVVILTNLDGEQASALEIGAADYIIKANTSLDEMIAKVRALAPN